MNDNNQQDGEIVGLHVQPGDLIWLKREVMDPSKWLKVVMLLLCK
jgi:hypothetical protein